MSVGGWGWVKRVDVQTLALPPTSHSRPLLRLMALDTAPRAGQPNTRQLASAFECAVMDVWAQV